MKRTALVAVFPLVLASGCGWFHGDRSDEEEILEVMERGRTALLEGDARTACPLLTPHGRQRTLAWQVDYLKEGTPVPTKRPGVPQTCEEIFRGEYREEHLPDASPSFTPDLRKSRFEVAWISKEDRRAKVLLLVEVPYGDVIEFDLVDVPGQGWRVDDSEALPRGY